MPRGTSTRVALVVASFQAWFGRVNGAAGGHHSPIYVFALQATKDQAKLDMLDSSQWEFYVVPTRWIDTPAAGRRNISLETLRASPQFGKPVSYRNLAARIGVVAGLGTS